MTALQPRAARGPTYRLVHPKVRCTGHSTTTGEPCRAWSVVGARVCVAHGGAARHVRRAGLYRVATQILERQMQLAAGRELAREPDGADVIEWLAAGWDGAA